MSECRSAVSSCSFAVRAPPRRRRPRLFRSRSQRPCRRMTTRRRSRSRRTMACGASAGAGVCPCPCRNPCRCPCVGRRLPDPARLRRSGRPRRRASRRSASSPLCACSHRRACAWWPWTSAACCLSTSVWCSWRWTSRSVPQPPWLRRWTRSSIRPSPHALGLCRRVGGDGAWAGAPRTPRRLAGSPGLPRSYPIPFVSGSHWLPSGRVIEPPPSHEGIAARLAASTSMGSLSSRDA